MAYFKPKNVKNVKYNQIVGAQITVKYNNLNHTGFNGTEIKSNLSY